MVRAKYRLRFQKTDDLRWISHHDLLRCFERMVRRSGLPVRSTQGFNPKPRLTFAMSLALGIIGRQEVAQLELDEEVPAETVRERLRLQAPRGLDIQTLRLIDARLTAQVYRVVYRLDVPVHRRCELHAQTAALLSQPSCWIERTRPHVRRINARAYIRDLIWDDLGLQLDLAVSREGTVRPEEVLGLLGAADLLDMGAVLERILVAIEDECAVSSPLADTALGADSLSVGAALVSCAPCADTPTKLGESSAQDSQDLPEGNP